MNRDVRRRVKARSALAVANEGFEGRQECVGLTQAEVGEILGLSRQAVCQIERKALRKLRGHPLIRELAQEFGWEEEQ